MRTLIFLFFILSSAISNSQADLYWQVRKVLEHTHPEISLSYKLLAVNLWKVSDAESRNANKAFDKAYKVYEYAKLSGGPGGIVVVSVNLEEPTSLATISYNKDGIEKVISLKLSELENIEPGTNRNIVYDSNGRIVYKDLSSPQVFESINKLITR